MSQALDQLLADAVARGDVRGVAATAGTAQDITYTGAAGTRNEAGATMGSNSVFWIASMTKAITSACALQLVDQGRLTLDTPIGNVLPKLENPQVLTGFDSDGTPSFARRSARSRCAICSLTRAAMPMTCGGRTCCAI